MTPVRKEAIRLFRIFSEAFWGRPNPIGFAGQTPDCQRAWDVVAGDSLRAEATEARVLELQNQLAETQGLARKLALENEQLRIHPEGPPETD